MSQSIHVPATVVEKAAAVVKWLVPIIGTGALSALGLGWTWLHSRTSMVEVAPKIAEVAISAKAAQSDAHHCAVEVESVKALALETARTQLETWAVAEVDRQYSRSSRRAEYIERARRFYLAAFEMYLERNPNEAAKALSRARQSIWRPDRED